MAAPQQTQIPPQLILLLLMPPMIVMVIWTAISTRNPFIFAAVALAPVMVFLLNRIDLWLVLVVALSRSNLKPPGMLGQLEMFEILVTGLVGVLVVRHTIVKHAVHREGWMWKLLILVMGIIVLTMYIRGTGFRFLGDTKWGGMRYVRILLMALLPFVVWHVQMRPEQWRKALILMMLLGLVPMAADAVYIFSRGELYHQYLFIQHGTVVSEVEQLISGGVTRLRAAGQVGSTLLMLPFFLFRPIARNAWKYIPFIVAGFIVGSFSGHRLTLFGGACFLAFYSIYVFRRHRGLILVGLSAGAVLVMAFAAGFGRMLPLSTQRAITFIPFADVEPHVRMNARGTLNWRLNVWKDAWREEVPQYLWIGKGYAFNNEMLQSLVYTNSYVERWASVQAAYHNGPLSLLIGLGIPGLVTGLALLLSAWYRHWRLNRADWYDEDTKRYHTLMFISLTYAVMSFIFIYGDTFVSFPQIFFTLAIMEGLCLSDVRARAAAPQESKSPASEQGREVEGHWEPIRVPTLRPI
jgi:hypothetical protein